MDKYLEIKENLLAYAKKDTDVTAIIAFGSSTRKDIKADEFSDLDLFIVTKNPDKWFSGEIPALFGNINISFIESTIGGGKEKRIIYDEDKDVDMIILTPEQMESAIREGIASWVMNRGYHVMYDVNGVTKLLEEFVKPVVTKPDMSEEVFNNMVNDFYFHNIWAYKKLKRGELWSAKMNVDAYLKNYLLRMIEYYCYLMNGVDVWHDGRFIDRWAEPSILKDLSECFAHYDTEDVKSALIHTHQLFARLSKEIAYKKGFTYPDKARICAAKYLGIVK